MTIQQGFQAQWAVRASGETLHLSAGDAYAFVFPSGGCTFTYGGTSHVLGQYHMVCMAPRTAVTLLPAQPAAGLSALWVRYTPAQLSALSDETTDLAAFFANAGFRVTAVQVECSLLTISRHLVQSLLREDETAVGSTVYMRGVEAMLAVLLMRAWQAGSAQGGGAAGKALLLDEVFAYIEQHISEELPLERLEKQFFISKYALTRACKKHTGQTLHAYIVKRKLALCKGYLAEGLPVAEVYERVGLGGYNHFFRAFKKEFGVTPKAYSRLANEKQK